MPHNAAASRREYSNTPRGQHRQIPKALRKLPRWMGTRYQARKDGKRDKPPHRVRRGLSIVKADKTEPDNWATFDEALEAYERGDVDAIGFVITESDPFFLVDCDGVIDTDTGELHPAAAEVIHALCSYTEVSCSGTGVHVIGTGAKPDYARCRSKTLGFDLEVYDSKRFVVLTGARISATTTIEAREQVLDELCRKLWKPHSGAHSTPNGHSDSHAGVDDEELLERARRARTGARFRQLYDRGDTSRYASQSEADFALLNALIFWTAGDRERIIRLFRASALYREDKHRGYVESSTNNALASYVGSFYKPRSVSRARREEPSKADPLTPFLKVLLDPSAWPGRRAAAAYKAFAGGVILGAEHGVIDEDGNLRIGCDIRRLAEVAGTSFVTLSRSALPYLVQEKKLLRWRRGKGKQAGVLVLLNPRGGQTANNKISTHFIVSSSHTPEHALETLRLIIRMRSGYSKRAKLLRLGMPAMFVTVALAAGGVRRGQTITELGERTGRRKPDLRRVLKRLKAAGIAREVARDVYRLTDDFAAQYERVLDQSGIAYAEREQRRRHDADRTARDAKLPVDKQPAPLRGKEHNRRVIAERGKEDARRQVERERQKAGTTAATFLADELAGARGCRWRELRQRWAERGRKAEELQHAIRDPGGLYKFQREEADFGQLYVYRKEAVP
jgi:putative DNA primase/helicase